MIFMKNAKIEKHIRAVANMMRQFTTDDVRLHIAASGQDGEAVSLTGSLLKLKRAGEIRESGCYAKTRWSGKLKSSRLPRVLWQKVEVTK